MTAVETNLLALFNKACYNDVEKLAMAYLNSGRAEKPAVWKILGSAQLKLQKYAEARESHLRALDLQPADPETLNNYAVVLKKMGDFSGAKEAYLKAARVAPHLTAIYSNLAGLCCEIKEYRLAEIAFTIALEHGKKDIALIRKLAEIYYQSGSYTKCVELIGQNEKLTSSCHDLLILAANSYKALNRLKEAINLYGHILTKDPTNWQAMSNLAVAYRDAGKLSASVEQLRRAIDVNGGSASLYTNLGVVLRELGLTREASEAYARALDLEPELWVAHSNYIFSLTYDPNTSLDTYSTAINEFAFRISKSLGCTTLYDPEKIKEQRPRVIGFVTGDLWAHPVCYFLYSLVANLPRAGFRTIAYLTKPNRDLYSERIYPFFDKIKRVYDLTDAEAANQVVEDNVDILIDLSGHTGGNRLPIFQFRPAPLQLTWLGYNSSTGLPVIDYIVGDRFVTPMSSQKHFREKIFQLPNCYICYTPPVSRIPIADPPCMSSGSVTFGSFNNPSKITLEVKTLWAKILESVPGSSLLLKYRNVTEKAISAQLQNEFHGLGIASNRIILDDHVPSIIDHFSAYARVDIALDPFPYNGVTTTIDALWMGVPTITLKGDRFASRNGETIVRATGMSSWLAESKDDYVALAVTWSKKPRELATLRRGLRAMVESSPLMDGKRFAADFQEALYAMWKERMSMLRNDHVAAPTLQGPEAAKTVQSRRKKSDYARVNKKPK